MENSHDFYNLFNNYWWLLLPLGWAIYKTLNNILRHNRACDALAMLKTYADQGREPPPELVSLLRQPEQVETHNRSRIDFSVYGWILVFLFAASACGVALMAAYPPDAEARMPTLMGAITCAGLALGFFVAIRAYKRQDRNPLQ